MNKKITFTCYFLLLLTTISILNTFPYSNKKDYFIKKIEKFFQEFYTKIKKTPEIACNNLFGKENAIEDVQNYFKQASQNFYIEPANIKYLDIKKPVPAFLSHYFSSFTWFGTWIDKESWEKMTKEEKEFTAYHETAHVAQKHPIKLISLFLATTSITGYATRKYSLFVRLISIAGSWILTLPIASKLCEEEADKIATQILCKNNKKNIITHHINALSCYINNNTSKKCALCSTLSNIWFYSLQKQIHSLQNWIKNN